MAEQEKSGKLKFWRQADGSGQLRMGDWGPPKPRLQDGLLFRRPADGSGKLVFGYTVNPGTATTPDADIGIDATFAGDMRADVRISLPVGLGIDANFAGDMACEIVAVYDPNVDRSCLGWHRNTAQPAQPIASSARTSSQPSAALSAAHRHRSLPAQPLSTAHRSTAQPTLPLSTTARQRLQVAQPIGTGTRGSFQRTINLHASTRQRLQVAVPIALHRRALYQQTINLRSGARQHLQTATAVAMHWQRSFANALALPQFYRQRLQTGRQPVYHWHPLPPEPEPDDDQLCYCPETLGQLVFRRPFTADGKLLFVCRPCLTPGPDPDPGPGGLIVVPIRGAYVVINDLHLARADDGTPIDADAFTLALDADSWTWQWSASLPLWEQDKIMPAGTDPVGIIATVNGAAFHLLAERFDRQREFGFGRIHVSGRGRSAMLSESYAPSRHHSSAIQQTAQQLMLAALTINGVSIGWDLDWQITDWTIPANTLSTAGAPIDAILHIAAAAGAIVQPHRTAQTLRILPRYVAAPWHWASQVTPDIELPSAAVQVEGIEWQQLPEYDRIFVSGTTDHGVLAQATRQGRPGTEPMPTELHPLITDLAAARQLAIARLGMAGRIAMVDLRLPVLPETGIIQPGQMVKYTDGPAGHRLGAVRAVRVDWSRPTLRQTITLETHE